MAREEQMKQEVGPPVHRLVLPFVVLAVSCAHLPAKPQRPIDVLVIAPHPDDEVLLAGGVLALAVKAGQRAEVIIVTNGDFTCERDGTVRQGESVSALTALGLPEAAIHFLGYPDGHLPALSATPLPPFERRVADGVCGKGETTWASRGEGGVDEHTARTGSAAAWTAENLTEDLTALLTRLRPRHVYLPHPLDAHGDHAATYLFFRRALDRVALSPEVHRGMVHAGRCWPSDCRTFFTPQDPLLPPAVLAGVEAVERPPVDASWKLALITHYPSQTGPEPVRNWLASFARPNELFFPERYEREGARWVHAPAGAASEFPVEQDSSPTHDGVHLVVDQSELRLENAEGGTLVRWPRPAGPLTVRIDPAGAAWEWSLYGPAGLVTVAVVPASR